jgi:hypothetical protein
VRLLRAVQTLLFGETWLLPIGVACVVAASALLRAVLGDGWPDVGGFVLLAGVGAVLVLSVDGSARPRR